MKRKNETPNFSLFFHIINPVFKPFFRFSLFYQNGTLGSKTKKLLCKNENGPIQNPKFLFFTLADGYLFCQRFPHQTPINQVFIGILLFQGTHKSTHFFFYAPQKQTGEIRSAYPCTHISSIHAVPADGNESEMNAKKPVRTNDPHRLLL